MSLGNIPVGVELLVKLLVLHILLVPLVLQGGVVEHLGKLLDLPVLPLLQRGHVKLHLGCLHLVKGVVAGSGRSLWALGDNWLPRVTLP